MTKKLKSLEISDSHLFKVTLVVAITKYSTTFGDEHDVTALDLIVEMISNDPEIAIIDMKETKLELVETQ